MFYIKKYLKQANIKYTLFALPCKTKRITLLKSPHVNKKAREQFEIRVYSNILKCVTQDSAIIYKVFKNKPKLVTTTLTVECTRDKQGKIV